MNTVERIVACYFQLVRKCLTGSDIKVLRGNNRQFDLLAFNVPTGAQYHIETGVTHEENWCPTPAEIATRFQEKFFGVPKPRKGRNTDFAKKKSYLPAIKETYSLYGFDYERMTRVWCCWTVRDGSPEEVAEELRALAGKRGVRKPRCEVISMRDTVIPQLTRAIGKSNYEDDVLRMISLLEQRRVQVGRREEREAEIRGRQQVRRAVAARRART